MTKDSELEELRLLCRMCNTEWIEKRQSGYLVRYEKDNNYLINRNDPEKKKYFRCSHFGSRSKMARLPVRSVMKIKKGMNKMTVDSMGGHCSER